MTYFWSAITIKMKKIQANNYPIFFGEYGYNFLNEYITNKAYSNLFILVDTNTNELCLTRFLSYLATDLNIEIIEIEPGENEKNITTCVEIWSILTDLGGDRKSLIINLGGGVITDIGGFIASTFKRGIDYIHIPTTLLAMVDASIGGKNGVDLGNLKNQIGVISFPQLVIIDSEYLTSLPQNEMRSGLAEMLKHGLIYDANYWNIFKDLDKFDFADFETLIHRSIEIKNEIVIQDPNEKDIRKTLNFGHTLGHAIESYFLKNSNKISLLHGEAVAVGMILESYISYQKNILSKEKFEEIKTTISNIFEIVHFEEKDIPPILELLSHDKKNEYGKIQFTLLKDIGQVILDQEAEKELIIESFYQYKS